MTFVLLVPEGIMSASGELKNDVLLTREEAAERLRVTIRTIDRWRAAKRIKDVPVGDARVMIPESSIQEFLDDSSDRRYRHLN